MRSDKLCPRTLELASHFANRRRASVGQPDGAVTACPSGGGDSDQLSRANRPGYVLVMCLFLIAMAGLLVAGIVRFSLMSALGALDATAEFQAQWSLLSIRRTALDRAPLLFHEQEKRFSVPVNTIRFVTQVNDCRINCQLTDEDAKANVNTLFSLGGKNALRRELSRADPETSRWLDLRPFTEGSGMARFGFSSWGQLYVLDGEGDETQRPISLAATARIFTCWGSGKVNIRRASKESLQAIVKLAVDHRAVQQILSLRHQEPQPSLNAIVASLGLREEPRNKLLSVLADTSRWYALTVQTTNDQSSHLWNRLYVSSGFGRFRSGFFFSW